MAKTCDQMIERVNELIGRKETTSNLALDSIVLDALNEAQRKIAEKVPNCLDLQVSDETTFDAATNIYSLDLSTLTVKVSHMSRVWLLDGLSTAEILFMERDRFMRRYPAISSLTAGLPRYWTRTGDTVYFSCPFSSTYDAKDIRIDYSKKPTDFETVSSTATSTFTDADEGLILYGQYKALEAISRKDAATIQKAGLIKGEWVEWLNEFQTRHDLETERDPYMPLSHTAIVDDE